MEDTIERLSEVSYVDSLLTTGFDNEPTETEWLESKVELSFGINGDIIMTKGQILHYLDLITDELTEYFIILPIKKEVRKDLLFNRNCSMS